VDGVAQQMKKIISLKIIMLGVIIIYAVHVVITKQEK
jgi:hypothetical protein